jgi:hypothetical protein
LLSRAIECKILVVVKVSCMTRHVSKAQNKICDISETSSPARTDVAGPDDGERLFKVEFIPF